MRKSAPHSRHGCRRDILIHCCEEIFENRTLSGRREGLAKGIVLPRPCLPCILVARTSEHGYEPFGMFSEPCSVSVSHSLCWQRTLKVFMASQLQTSANQTAVGQRRTGKEALGKVRHSRRALHPCSRRGRGVRPPGGSARVSRLPLIIKNQMKPLLQTMPFTVHFAWFATLTLERERENAA